MDELKKRKPLVFTEWHHGGLFQAMVNLFEKRLGGMVFAPMGYDWVKNKIWRLSEKEDTIKQYLDPNSCQLADDGFYYYYDKAELRLQRRITFEEFKKIKFDIILCTLLQHEFTFYELRNNYQPQAKYIRLAGNWGEIINWDIVQNFIDTTGLYQCPPEVNRVVINQEFPLEYFYYSDPVNHKKIVNFMNCLKESPAYKIWKILKDNLPEFEFKMYGIGGDDGFIEGLPFLAEEMRKSSFIFQVKHHGEGFGHIIHNAYAVGRPVITLFEFYRGKLASRFLIDNITAIFLDDLSVSEAVKKIRYFSDPINHKRMCRKAYNLFKAKVNFDEDEKKIRNFLKNLK